MSIAKLKEDFNFKYDSADVGKHIARLRKAKKWSLHKLSYESCLDVAVLMRIEKGVSSPVLDTLLKIIDGLDLT
ncbi:MAG: helix-turn-helix transcriptional regulator, partial [Candidatus Margulisbacteria bacterium]|nr:helix-turn-helix transcriptional regulator [Candidatus Margulisiibacteriota bacterium]